MFKKIKKLFLVLYKKLGIIFLIFVLLFCVNFVINYVNTIKNINVIGNVNIKNENFSKKELYNYYIDNEDWYSFFKNIQEDKNNIQNNKKYISDKIKKSKNIYILSDNIELYKLLIFLEKNAEKNVVNKNNLEKNINKLINYKTRKSDEEFTIIKSIFKIVESNIFDYKINLELLKINYNRINNLIDNHTHLLEKNFLNEKYKKLLIKSLEDICFLYEKIYNIKYINYKDEESLNFLKIENFNNKKINEKYIAINDYLECKDKIKKLHNNFINNNITNKIISTTQKVGIGYVGFNNISTKNYGLIKGFFATLYITARTQDEYFTNKILDDNNFYLQKRKQSKMGLLEPLKITFLNFINRFILFFNTKNKGEKQGKIILNTKNIDIIYNIKESFKKQFLEDLINKNQNLIKINIILYENFKKKLFLLDNKNLYNKSVNEIKKEFNYLMRENRDCIENTKKNENFFLLRSELQLKLQLNNFIIKQRDIGTRLNNFINNLLITK